MYIAARTTLKNTEGSTYESFGTPASFVGEQWPASGKVQAQMYGEKLSYIRNVKIEGDYQISVDQQTGQIEYQFANFDVHESDRIYIDVPNTADPDYKILSIKPYKPLRLEVIKI